MELIEFFAKIPPAELARLRNRRQDTSTRDKKTFLSIVEEIEGIVKKKNGKIIVNILENGN